MFFNYFSGSWNGGKSDPAFVAENAEYWVLL